MMRNKRFWTGLVLVITIGVGLFSFKTDQKNFELAKNLDIYHTLFRELSFLYVDEINPGELVKTSIDEMLSSLDPYTNFISEDQMEDFRFETTGEYAGIGAAIRKQGDHVVIAEPYEGFPAYEYGLKAGDLILEVDGKETKGMSTSDVTSLLKGPANNPVSITVERYGENKPITIEVIRKKITIKAVPYYGMLDDKTAYIRLEKFTQHCSQEVKNAFLDLKKNNPESLVLDLRGNPGGLLNEAVSIVNFFVPQGEEIVSTKGKVKQWDKTYKANATPLDTTIRIAVLTNRGSASASEIVSGALQDLDRGIIIGTRTFGKGLVQTTRDLSYNTKLKVTTAKYYIPSGRCIQALDYSHRNEDGSVGHVPDSMITRYNTKNGRIVYDGGGIVPDVKINRDKPSNLTIAMVTNFLIFDFATRFAVENKSIASPEEFEITDDIYNQFTAFVKENKFNYESSSVDEFEALVKSAKEEKYYALAAAEFEALKERLTPSLDKDLELFRDEISPLLADEIVSRYYFQEGAIRVALNNDEGIDEALNKLNSIPDYESYFESGREIPYK